MGLRREGLRVREKLSKLNFLFIISDGRSRLNSFMFLPTQ